MASDRELLLKVLGIVSGELRDIRQREYHDRRVASEVLWVIERALRAAQFTLFQEAPDGE